jgi:hypothetical protein
MPAEIAKAGLELYKDGQVRLAKTSPNSWTASVLDGELHKVTVALAESGALSSAACDCADYWDEHCRHQAAVLYAILGKGAGQADGTASEDKAETAVAGTGLEAFARFYASQDALFRACLALHGAAAHEAEGIARSLIATTVDAASIDGTVPFENLKRATLGARRATRLAAEMASQGDREKAAIILMTVAEEMLALKGAIEAPAWVEFNLTADPVETLGEIVEAAGLEESEAVFDAVLARVFRPGFEDKAAFFLILKILAPLCNDQKLRARMESAVRDRQLANDAAYLPLEEVLLLVSELHDSAEEAIGYVERNPENIPRLPQIASSALDRGDLKKALELCLYAEAKGLGQAGELKRMRYEVYSRLEDVEAQRALAMELLLDGDFGYYLEYRSLFEPKEWPVRLEALIELVKAREADPSATIRQMLAQEKSTFDIGGKVLGEGME